MIQLMMRSDHGHSPRGAEGDIILAVATLELERIFEGFKSSGGEVIPLLQRLQREYGYLPAEALEEVARFTRTPPSRVYGVATFYAQFRLTPSGRHLVQVCQGTACHVRGGKGILETVARELDIEPDGTTEDREFTLEVVRCIGCCSLAPVMVIDGEATGRLTPSKTLRTLRRHYEGERVERS
jgi:NADH-quinone oxidoreductase subunit E